ncbi:ElyC/SanA/YdcF family protein [Aliihoeflea sp. 40Bstr573]|uniref:YdcF family protein n=1 Tax=Aliihoeflea sp. 40Bstr573 TaxID=2696467 RepID=UPI0020960E06|nr:YdcF family protein [Aliihoeflea sp. 40Bstr573]
MFFYLSKIFWLFAHPLNLTGILLFVGLVLLFLQWTRLAGAAFSVAFVVLALSTWTSIGALMLHPLEDRFARPDPASERIDGIIVLGGGFEGSVNLARGGYELNSSGDRFVETAVLARLFPNVPVVVSGGTGTIALEGEGDADTAPRLLNALGIDEGRLVLENRSRNTDENARFSRDMVSPQNGQTWLLVTSAFHMPRSVLLFEKAGFDVVPWPADYRTAGDETPGLAQDNAIDSLQNTAIAIREWIGLVAYRLTGRTDRLLP